MPGFSQTPDEDDDYIPGMPRRADARDSRGAAFEPADAPRDDAPAPPILVLASPAPQSDARLGVLFRLVHVLGLDSYGTATLSRAARLDMTAAALLLAVIFVFDVLGWGLLFYFVMSSGSTEFRLSSVMFSLLGILPAVALLLYERGFMTSDLKTGGAQRLRVLVAMVGRMVVIGVAALITAQPIELITFARRIERRTHEERIREAAVGRFRELQEQLQSRGNVNVGAATVDVIRKDIDATTAQIDSLQKEESEAKDRAAAATRRMQDAKTVRDDRQIAWNRARNAPTAATRQGQDAINRTRAAFEAAHDNWMRRREQAARENGILERLTNRLGDAQKRREGQTGDLVTGMASMQADERVRGLKQWVLDLRKLTPGQPFRDPISGTASRFPDYDFLEQLRVLDDVRTARPPRWPPVDPAIRKQLEQEYGLYDDTDEATRRIDARNASYTYWAIFGMAVLVPFMSLLFKLLMPTHLGLYYSSDWQARQGDPWAMAAEAALRRRPRTRDDASRIRQDPGAFDRPEATA